MISPHIAIHDLDPIAWRNAQRLLQPPSRGGARPSTANGARAPLVLFIEGGSCVKALRVGGEPIAAADYPWSGVWSLGKLRRAAGAPIALAVEDDALERMYAEFESHLSASDDLVAQGLALARAARAEVGKGFHLDPDPLARVPIPSFAALQKTFDALLPDGRSAGLFVFDHGALWTSLIVEKRDGDVVRLTTHAALGLPRPDFRNGNHREILHALETHVARPHLCLFLSLDAWREVVGSDPGALARQVAAREAIIDPCPPWLMALTGVAAMAGVAQGAGRLFGRFVPQVVKDTARAMTPLAATPFAALGFDPIALFSEIQKFWGGK